MAAKWNQIIMNSITLLFCFIVSTPFLPYRSVNEILNISNSLNRNKLFSSMPFLSYVVYTCTSDYSTSAATGIPHVRSLYTFTEPGFLVASHLIPSPIPLTELQPHCHLSRNANCSITFSKTGWLTKCDWTIECCIL